MSNAKSEIKAGSHYYGIDFLRAFCCLAILVMHVGANSQYVVDGFLYDTIIGSWKNLVFLFMMISGFGMSCGYYNKIKSGKVDFNSLYSKRYIKILPFFAFLLLIAMVMEHQPETFMESFAEATLMFGLLPSSQLDTIGVSWTLGVIFVFYLVFPFIVFLTYTKKRAILTFIGSVIMNYLCVYYFFTDKFVNPKFSGRANFLYCLPYFLAGVIIYLYSEQIKQFVSSHKLISFVVAAGCIVLYYIIPYSVAGFITFTLKNVIVSCAVLMFAIGCEGRLSNNKVVAYISGISMEIYLCQMILFRLTEKAHLLYLFGNGWLSFAAGSIITFAFILAFIEFYKNSFKIMQNLLRKINQR